MTSPKSRLVGLDLVVCVSAEVDSLTPPPHEEVTCYFDWWMGRLIAIYILEIASPS